MSLDFTFLSEIFVVGLSSWIVKLLFKPGKYEVKFLSRFFTLSILFLIDIMKSWYKKHPEVLHKYLDKIYSNIFHARHYLDKEENDTIIVG